MAFFNINRVETGNRIVKRRKAMGLSRDGLADLLWGIGVEVSITSIGKWERGECDISEEHARALCQIFGCKPCELIVARLSFYDDERDQLAPLKITYFHILTSICLRRCSSFLLTDGFCDLNMKRLYWDYTFWAEDCFHESI